MIVEAPPVLIKLKGFDEPALCVGTTGNETPVVDNMLDVIAKWVWSRIDSDNQVVIIVRGGTGTGKSNVSLRIIKALLPDFGPDDLPEVYIYEAEDLAKKIRRKSLNPINWYDEGSVTFNSLNVMTKGGRVMGSFFDTMRIRHYVSIICMPEDKEMDSRVYKHADMIIECRKYAPFPDFNPREFFYVHFRTVYPSGRVWTENVAIGIHKRVPKRMKKAYDVIKAEHAAKFENRFLETFL